MGKIEKVVALSVALLMVVLIVVNTTGSKDTPIERKERVVKLDPAGGRLRNNDRGNLGSVGSGNRRLAAAQTREDADRWQSQAEPSQARPQSAQALGQPEGLLSAPVRRGSTQRQMEAAKARAAQAQRPVAQTAAPAAAGLVRPKLQSAPKPDLDPSWSLVRIDGLGSMLNPAYKTYECRKGDTFESVARRFYGDKRHAHFLRRNNEGVRTLQAKRVLLMPCVNETPLANTYTVAEGDSLWSIAKEQYNAGHRWNEIYDANRHVLRSPDDLRQGLQLTIP